MASSMFFPIKPIRSVDLGDNVFVVVSEFHEVVRVHIRRYIANAVTYQPTTEGVSFVMSDWREIASHFNEWAVDIESSTPEGILFASPKMAVSYFTYNNEIMVSFVLANRKQINLVVSQFKKIIENVDEIEDWYQQLAGGQLEVVTDAQVY